MSPDPAGRPKSPSADGRARSRRAGSAGAGLSALPSRLARALAFSAILAGGACGALIGYGVMRSMCKGDDCGTSRAVGAVFGGVFVAVGVAVIAVLTLRAMGEWRVLNYDDRSRVTLGGTAQSNESSSDE